MTRTFSAGYARGEETRTRIIEVAVTLFAQRGFDTVTTRDIAAASSVPQASLRYYFKSKQGLYVACLQHVQAMIFRMLEPALQDAERLLTDQQADSDAMIGCFCALQEALIGALVGQPDDGRVALFLIRHDLPSDAGAENFMGEDVMIDRMTTCFAELIVRISHHRLDVQSASRVAGLINGQITNVYLRRHRLMMEGWNITPERLDWIKRMINQHTKAMLACHRAD